MKKLTLGIFSLVLISLLISCGSRTLTVSKSIEEFFNKKVSVDISQIDITLSDNKNIRESVTLDKGYLVITDISDIKDVKILNEKDEVQSTLSDIENIVDEMDFNIYNTR